MNFGRNAGIPEIPEYLAETPKPQLTAKLNQKVAGLGYTAYSNNPAIIISWKPRWNPHGTRNGTPAHAPAGHPPSQGTSPGARAQGKEEEPLATRLAPQQGTRRL